VYTGEAVFGVIALFLRDFSPVPERVETAVARMEAVPGFLAQGKTNVRRAPRAWIDRAVRECAGARAFFQDGVATLIGDLAITDRRVRTAADRGAAAVAEFQGYLETELTRRAHDGYACGGEAFDLLLRRGHFLDIDAAAVRGTAEARLAECEAALRVGAREFGAGSWREALARLAEYHPTPSEY